MRLTDLSGKRIAIWGQGKEGVALSLFFEKEGISFQKVDSTNEQEILSCDIVFKSPGISIYHPLVEQARKLGIKITSGTNFYMENKPEGVKTIGVTGTKGKSTTSALMAHVLKKMGYKVGYGGNIGFPLINLYKEPLDFLVAEMSSYQCTDLSVGFDVTIITNLYPEHIDWHKTHEQYYRDKLHILEVRESGQKAILNAKNERLLEMTRDLKDVVYFNQSLLPVKTNLLGLHNQENIDAVLTALKELKLPRERFEEYIEDFYSLPHRMEVFKVNGVVYVDDSISTTPETSIAALKVFEGERRFLLVGGFDRHQDYTSLLNYVRGKKITLVCLPDTGRLLYEKGEDTYMAADMHQAVKYVKEKAKVGDIVILSPGSASYNMYKNFEERGEEFKRLVRDVCDKKE